MKAKYITIEREYGSGGTTIGRLLSEETGVPCYGREILEAVAKSGNISIDEVERYEESVTNSLLYSLYVMGQASRGETDMLSKEGHIFVAEQQEIQRLSKRGRAIFLGHCAAEALQEQNDVIRVFIHCSDEEAKRKRTVVDYGIREVEADSVRKRFNKKRANYYHANTGKKWDDYRNYDVVLDSGTLGIEGCVNLLEGLF